MKPPTLGRFSGLAAKDVRLVLHRLGEGEQDRAIREDHSHSVFHHGHYGIYIYTHVYVYIYIYMYASYVFVGL